MLRASILPATLCFAPLILSVPAMASSPAFGASMSVTIAQQMMASPPLPSLEGGKVTISPQYGYVNAHQEFTEPLRPPAIGTEFRAVGDVSGNTYGLALSVPTKGDFGFFAFAVGATITGSSTATQDGVVTYEIAGVESTAHALVGGVSYRLLGDDKSLMALGFFGGPAVIAIKSKAAFQSANTPAGVPPANFTFNPDFVGAYWGLQTSLRLKNFVINPYIVSFMETGGTGCKTISSDGPDANNSTGIFSCNGQSGKTEAYAGFAGYGLFLGYKKFRINVYSNGNLFDTATTVTSYSVSFGF